MKQALIVVGAFTTGAIVSLLVRKLVEKKLDQWEETSEHQMELFGQQLEKYSQELELKKAGEK